MSELLLCVVIIAIAASVYRDDVRVLYEKVRKGMQDPLRRYEPVTEEELLLLTMVEEDLYEDLLKYVRTMVMSVRLQDFLSDKKDALESISLYMMLQVARKEQEKKERWEKERISETLKPQTHVEKLIARGLRRF